jgi:hypothetical protein
VETLLLLPVNIRLEWTKVTNTLSYNDTYLITTVKSFIVQAVGVTINPFYNLSLVAVQNKLECLSLKFFSD